MKETSRDERYLRILTYGISGKDDYEDARYLIDKSYIEGAYQLSKMRDTYGKVLSVVSRGPTTKGIGFIDELKIAQPNQSNALNPGHSLPIQKRSWNLSPIGTIGIGIIITVLGSFALYLIKHYLGISL